MEFHEAAAALQALRRHRPKLGVGTTRRMLSALGNPEEGVEFVQIAGTNGKGSTARMLESVLREGGLEVGLFTSPALVDVREQIRVDGRQITKADLATLVEDIHPCLEELRAEDDAPTHFEVLTALAITHFGREDVDVAILEVGIGGRYDATSAIEAAASAVTSVSLEHTDLLGETVEEIARDKAQVAARDAPLVTGATGDALAAIREETPTLTVGPHDTADVRALETGMRSRVESELCLAAGDWRVETALSLLGQHQAENAGVAAALARQVADVDRETLARGLRKTTWPGRFDILGSDPMVVLDGAHNPAAARTLSNLIDRYDYENLHLVFGAMADKDHDGMLAELPAPDTAILTQPATERAAATADLATTVEDRFAALEHSGEAQEESLAAHDHSGASIDRVASVAEATERAIAAADERDFVVVTGSLYTVAEARDRWTRPPVPKDGGRRLAERAVFSEARFPDGSLEDVEGRVFSVLLRERQAERVAQRFDVVGGRCLRSERGAPGDYVATVLQGTVGQLRGLVSALESDGLGLARLGRQLDRLLGGVTAGPTPAAQSGQSSQAGQSAQSSQSSRFETDGTTLMGILNVTPDSFHDGGAYRNHGDAVEHAREMVAAGADIIDVGGESTRPGAAPVPASEEIDRVLPVIEALASLEVPISIDTRNAAVAEAALAAGAEVVNDVSGLGDPEMRVVVADHDATLVLMHSLSAPVDPDRIGPYDDVVDDVRAELNELILHAERAGVDRERIVVDPGCGFGKRPADSFELVDRIGEFHALGCPVLVGHSRKSMYDSVVRGPGERLPPTLAVTAMAAERGADVVRVHDVAETASVLRTVETTRGD
ncbi:MAG: dihydropteroate synthase [Haloarculaceae archaeon]